MNNTVLIKSFKNGINIKLDPNADFETIYDEFREKLTASAKFFADASLVISFEGRELTDEEEIHLLSLISMCTDIKVSCIVGMDERRELQYIKAANGMSSSARESNARFYKGSIKAGETLETDSSLIILGDVNPGGTVNASGNIVILGTLYGHVHAGCFGNNSSFVTALDIKPTRVRIGDHSEAIGMKSGILLKNKAVPKIIYVENDRITAKDLNAGIPDTIMS
ncbi:MAG: hypothetical protein K6F34_11515 [Lachnospiraceae bacterium]|nr:hypothetical protein [Lachnospiraceae bacterium]